MLKFATFDRRILFEIGQVWVAVMLANLLLYLYQLATARGLGPEEYSLFGALFGIVYLTSGLPNALQVAIARFVARSLAGAGSVTAGQLTTYSLFLSLLLGCIVLVIVSVASPLIGSYLHSDSLVPVVITGAIICLAMLVPAVQLLDLGDPRSHGLGIGGAALSLRRLLVIHPDQSAHHLPVRIGAREADIDPRR